MANLCFVVILHRYKPQIRTCLVKHANESTLFCTAFLGILDFVTILTNKYSLEHKFLFICPDEYALFKFFGQQDWCMTGNPGVSKSWFQWKLLSGFF